MSKKTKEQNAIANAIKSASGLVDVVERNGAHPHLTDAVISLGKAKDSLVAYVEDKPRVEIKAFNATDARYELEQYCLTAGLKWNEGNWQYALPIIVAQRLTHVQAVEVVKAHITLVAHLFNPKAYPWKGRLLLAAHFLFNFSRKKAARD